MLLQEVAIALPQRNAKIFAVRFFYDHDMHCMKVFLTAEMVFYGTHS